MKPKKLRFREVEDLMEFHEVNQGVIHLETFKVLKREWTKRKKCVDVDLFEVELTDDPEMEEVILNVLSEEWVQALEMALEYFEDSEQYETCSQINKLIKTIKKQAE